MWQPIFEVVGAYILCAIASERITECVVHGEIFAWLRKKPCEWQFAQNDPTKVNKFWKFCCKLLTCGYCYSHWPPMILVWFLPGDYFTLSANGCVFIKWLALVGLSNLYHTIFNLIYKGRVRTIDAEIVLDNRTPDNRQLPAVDE